MFVQKRDSLPRRRYKAKKAAQSAAIIDNTDMGTELATALADVTELATTLAEQVTELQEQLAASTATES